MKRTATFFSIISILILLTVLYYTSNKCVIAAVSCYLIALNILVWILATSKLHSNKDIYTSNYV